MKPERVREVINTATNAIEAFANENADLRAALAPFARLADGVSAEWADNRRLSSLSGTALHDITIGQARRAAQALAGDGAK